MAVKIVCFIVVCCGLLVATKIQIVRGVCNTTSELWNIYWDRLKKTHFSELFCEKNYNFALFGVEVLCRTRQTD